MPRCYLYHWHTSELQRENHSPLEVHCPRLAPDLSYAMTARVILVLGTLVLAGYLPWSAVAAESYGIGEGVPTPLVGQAGQALAAVFGVEGGGMDGDANGASRKILSAQSIDAVCTCGGELAGVAWFGAVHSCAQFMSSIPSVRNVQHEPIARAHAT